MKKTISVVYDGKITTEIETEFDLFEKDNIFCTSWKTTNENPIIDDLISFVDVFSKAIFEGKSELCTVFIKENDQTKEYTAYPSNVFFDLFLTTIEWKFREQK